MSFASDSIFKAHTKSVELFNFSVGYFGFFPLLKALSWRLPSHKFYVPLTFKYLTSEYCYQTIVYFYHNSSQKCQKCLSV